MGGYEKEEEKEDLGKVDNQGSRGRRCRLAWQSRRKRKKVKIKVAKRRKKGKV
jgi:hypothetical protein